MLHVSTLKKYAFLLVGCVSRNISQDMALLLLFFCTSHYKQILSNRPRPDFSWLQAYMDHGEAQQSGYGISLVTCFLLKKQGCMVTN